MGTPAPRYQKGTAMTRMAVVTGYHVVAKVADSEIVTQAIGSVQRDVGLIDAATNSDFIVPVSDITGDAWNRMLRVHLGGLRNTAYATLPQMLDRGHGPNLAIGGGDGDSHYAEARGAVIGSARTLAAEVAPNGLHINSIASGPTSTRMCSSRFTLASTGISRPAVPAVVQARRSCPQRSVPPRRNGLLYRRSVVLPQRSGDLMDTRQHQKGRIALVTGATPGIGRSITQRLAADGARVGVNGRSGNASLKAVVERINGLPEPADIFRPRLDPVCGGRVRTQRRVRRLPGVQMPPTCPWGALGEYPKEDWWKIVETNLTGETVRAIWSGMRRRGRGNIVIVTFEWDVTGWPRATAYAASMSGLINVTKFLGWELAPRTSPSTLSHPVSSTPVNSKSAQPTQT